MSLRRYAEYKAGGFSWAAELPAHWSTANLKWLCHRYSGGTPDKNKLEFWEGGTIPWLNSGAVNDGRIYEASAYITQKAFENSNAKWIPPGALVMALAGQGKTKGMVAQLMFASTCNQSMAAIVPSERIDARCLYWWLVCNYQNIRNMAGGDLRDGLNLDLLGTIPCPLPPLAEQMGIAAFLDRETAKIDVLIAEQEKLIALLAEKRQAIISHAVARGLNPNVPMKDSGVEWLGEVPVHWEVAALKRYWSVTDCKHITAEFVDDGYPLASIREVQSRFVSLDTAKRTTRHFYEQLIEGGRKPLPGDLIFSRNATVGEVAQVNELHPPFAMGQDVCLLRPLYEDWSSDFMQAVIRSSIVVEQLKNIMVGSTFKRVNVEEIRNLQVPAPPPDEQAKIAEFIINETNRLDLLKTEAERAVNLLNERRSALITAAVTGQIDVRGTRPQAAAASLDAIAA
ncbi:restriction endonuclease subunit S [Massilia niabensis]|uniref:Restriction endonuclease subunit S n=1 Tax=Massilia niabensis TaxID=544910 RepID=A0ABW0L5B6_9BURK